MNIELLNSCINQVKQRTNVIPKIALILGSGLGNFANRIKVIDVIPYHEIIGFPVSTVQGHKGQFIFGMIDQIPIVCMQGRVHYYEGYSMEKVVLPIRLMKGLGAEILFLTNAAGGMQDHMVPGDLMLITDHISSFVPSPLIGENYEDLGPRFPDMSKVYDNALSDIIRETAKTNGIALKEGIYIQFSGPQYETPAEIKMAKMLGADACGMSTVCEAIAANHMGMRICGVTCITNLASGLSNQKLSHDEVKKTADFVELKMAKLIEGSIKLMV